MKNNFLHKAENSAFFHSGQMLRFVQLLHGFLRRHQPVENLYGFGDKLAVSLLRFPADAGGPVAIVSAENTAWSQHTSELLQGADRLHPVKRLGAGDHIRLSIG
ncbi:hypothetical protein D3C76_1506340 [compost metagenome]